MAKFYHVLSIRFFSCSILFGAVAASRGDLTTGGGTISLGAPIKPCTGGCAARAGNCNNPGVGCDQVNMCTCVQTAANPAKGIPKDCNCTPPGGGGGGGGGGYGGDGEY